MNNQLTNHKQLWNIALIICNLSFFQYSFAAELTADKNAFSSDVIDIDETMLHPEYWADEISDGQNQILSHNKIHEDNQRLFLSNTTMTDLSSFPISILNDDVTKKILKISSPYSSTLYYSNGKKLTDVDYGSYYQNLDLTHIINTKDTLQKIQFGMVVRRTDMKRFPSSDKAFKTTTSINIDRFQETALFPTQVVAILHESLDKKWFFVISYNYAAWVKKADIAIGDKQTIINYKNIDQFLVVTASKIHTSSNPYNKDLSELQLEMGTVIPLVDKVDIPTTIGRQNTYTSYVVSLPVRGDDGSLTFQSALVSRSADVHKGFLPYTKSNIINQAFKFLGERYGWGHSFNARDCTGFVGEVYKSFGILMPRNSGDQSQSEQGKNTRFSSTASTSDKLEFFKELTVGDLIYRPGHVMMYLGSHKGQPFIIHDVSDLTYLKENGEYYKTILNGVSITPLLPLQLTKNISYVDKINNIKKIK